MSLFSKKKVLVLFGSPQSHGTTRKLLDSFLSGFHQNKDWSVEEVSLYELSPHPCTGCRACAKKEGCSFDDLDGLDKSLRACDLLVVASPVYNSSFPAPPEGVAGPHPAVFRSPLFPGDAPAHQKTPGCCVAAHHGFPGGLCCGGVYPSAGAGLFRDEHQLGGVCRVGRHRLGGPK